MATYYVDPLATGADDGTTQANAWTSVQRAIDGTGGTQPTAGDTVLCRANGTTPDETLTVQIDVDGPSGTLGAYLKFIGTNSAWGIDGTKYIIDGNSAVAACLNFGAMDYHNWYNFKCFGATLYQIDFNTLGASYCNLYNIHSSGGAGIRMYRNTGGSFIGGVAENSTNGLYNLSGECLFSVIRNNSTKGIDSSYAGSRIVGNLIYGNGVGVAFGTTGGGMALNNIIHGNTTGVLTSLTSGLQTIIGNRITNNNLGMDAQTFAHLVGTNYWQNTTDILDGGNILTLSPTGTDLNTWAGTDTDYGYVNSVGGDFNLAVGATMRDVSITLAA